MIPLSWVATFWVPTHWSWWMGFGLSRLLLEAVPPEIELEVEELS